MNKYRRDNLLIEAVAKKFRELRELSNKTQTDVYIDTDINMSRVEGGKTTLSLNTISTLCQYYGVGIKEFFNSLDI